MVQKYVVGQKKFKVYDLCKYQPKKHSKIPIKTKPLKEFKTKQQLTTYRLYWNQVQVVHFRHSMGQEMKIIKNYSVL